MQKQGTLCPPPGPPTMPAGGQRGSGIATTWVSLSLPAIACRQQRFLLPLSCTLVIKKPGHHLETSLRGLVAAGVPPAPAWGVFISQLIQH